ncbi:MAG TPA: lipopolysaccharide heptosyltransferase II [Bryobacteraceae bacterium]
MSPSRILVRATNWIGDAVMSIPALEAIRKRFPSAHITILARPWVSDVYRDAPFCDAIEPYLPSPGMKDWRAKLALARRLQTQGFDAAVILPNSFDSALICRLAKIPVRIGYSRDGRGILLTHAIARPKTGEVEPHERFYYLELLRRAGWIDELPTDGAPIRLVATPRALTDHGIEAGRPVIGLSPGAAFGTAKRWLPERFAESASELAGQWDAAVVIFGSKDERPVADEVAAGIRARGVDAVVNLAGQTNLREFIERVAACRFFLTNDNGAMHLAAALGVSTLAVFGSTDHTTTGPTGRATRIVREPVECSPCLKRECPIDHRCMTRVTVERVVQEALELSE